MNIEKKQTLFNLDENYSKKQTLNRKNVSNLMFKMFSQTLELSRLLRLSLKDNDFQNTRLKTRDIFLTLISLCNNLDIDLLNTLITQKEISNENIAKWV